MGTDLSNLYQCLCVVSALDSLEGQAWCQWAHNLYALFWQYLQGQSHNICKHSPIDCYLLPLLHAVDSGGWQADWRIGAWVWGC